MFHGFSRIWIRWKDYMQIVDYLTILNRILTANINKFAIGSMHPSKATRQDVGIGKTHLHDMWSCSEQNDSFLVLFFLVLFELVEQKSIFNHTYSIIRIYTHVFIMFLFCLQLRSRFVTSEGGWTFLFCVQTAPSKGWPFPESRRSTVASPLDRKKRSPLRCEFTVRDEELASLGGV